MSILFATFLLRAGLPSRSPGLVDLAIEASKFVPKDRLFHLDTFPSLETPDRMRVRAILLENPGKSEARSWFTAYPKGSRIEVSVHWGRLKPTPVDGPLHRAFALAARRLESKGIFRLLSTVQKSRNREFCFFSFEGIPQRPGDILFVTVDNHRTVTVMGGE